jgi:hypothetical protein
MDTRAKKVTAIIEASKHVATMAAINTAYTGFGNFIGKSALAAMGSVRHGMLSTWSVTQSGLIGGPIAGAVMGGLIHCGLFKKIENSPSIFIPVEILTAASLPLLSSMLGCVIKQAESSIAEVAASAAMGGALYVTVGGALIAVAYGAHALCQRTKTTPIAEHVVDAAPASDYVRLHIEDSNSSPARQGLR